MLLQRQKAMQQYGAQQEQQAEDASPHKMIAMLFDGAIDALNKMLWAMDNAEVEQRGQSSSKAIAIVNGMRDCLDIQAGGELAENLYGVYSFIAKDLLRANYENDVAATQEALRLLRTIKESWDNMPQGDGGQVEAKSAAMPSASQKEHSEAPGLVEKDMGSDRRSDPGLRKPALGLRQSAFYS